MKDFYFESALHEQKQQKRHIEENAAVSSSISILTPSLKLELICGALKPKTAKCHEFFIKRSSRKVCGRRIGWMMAADMSHLQRQQQQRPWPELRALFPVFRVNGFCAGWRGRRSRAGFSSSSRKIRMQPLLSEPPATFPAAPGPVTGRWMISAA